MIEQKEIEKYRVRDYYIIPVEIVDNIFYLFEQQCKKQKEVIAKIYELIKQHIRKDIFLELNEWQTRDLLKLLREVTE